MEEQGNHQSVVVNLSPNERLLSELWLRIRGKHSTHLAIENRVRYAAAFVGNPMANTRSRSVSDGNSKRGLLSAPYEYMQQIFLCVDLYPSDMRYPINNAMFV